MPETAVDENRNFASCKDKVSAKSSIGRERREVDSVTQTRRMDKLSYAQFGNRVSSLVPTHDRACCGARGPALGHASIMPAGKIPAGLCYGLVRHENATVLVEGLACQRGWRRRRLT